MTNAEADCVIREYIEENGRHFEALEIPLFASWLNIEPESTGVDKTETLVSSVPSIGVVSGIVMCKALVAIPGNERFSQTEAKGAMIISVNLGWDEEPTEFNEGGINTSRAIYRLEPHDPAAIDNYYQKLAQAEKNDQQAESSAESTTIDHIKIMYMQTMPEALKLPTESWEDTKVIQRDAARQANRAKIIRAFKDQHPHLTILSTTTGGNIHDDEIPLLAEWLIR